MTTILIKKKDTAGAPVAGDLTNAAGGAEIAVNTATKRLYTKDSGGNIVELGTNPSALTTNLLFSPDATYDIGASGASRPRDMFLSRNLTVGGTLTLAGGVNLNGNVTVGDSSADTLTINSTITSNLIFTDNTYDIGASGATRPRNLFLAGNITAGGSQTLTGALTVDSTTDSSSTTTGSIQTDGGVGIAKALYVGTTGTIRTVLTVGAAANTDAVALFDSLDANGSHLRLLNSNTVNTYFGAAAGISASGTASDTALRAQGALYFLTNGNNPRVTVTTDGYVGIRTTSPAGFLHVAPGNAAASSTAGAPIILQAQQGGASASGGNILIGSGQNGSGGTNGYIAFGVGSSTSGSAFASGEVGRFDVSGRFLVNLTSAVFTNSQIQATASSGPTLGIQQTTNTAYAGGFWNSSASADRKFLAFYYDAGGSQLASFEATGTTFLLYGAGSNGISINSSGYVGIATTTPTFSTSFSATSSTVLQVGNAGAGNGQVRVGGNTSSAIGLTLDYNNSGATTSVIRAEYGASSANAGLYLDSGFIAFRTGTSFTERGRFDSSGTLRVNNTSGGNGALLAVGSGFTTDSGSGTTIVTSGALEFNYDGVSGTQKHARVRGTGSTTGGAYAGGIALEYYAYISGSYQWATGLEIDSGGSTVMSGNTCYVAPSAGSANFKVQAPNAAGANAYLYLTCTGSNEGGFYYERANSRLWAYSQSGGVYLNSTATSWTSSSDERMKDIIEPIANAAQRLKGWRTVFGKFKTDKEGTRRAFFIAQDLLVNTPEVVDVVDPEKLGVHYTETIPVVAAAVNEHTDEIASLKAIIQQLTARLDAANI